jgi:hypothetical protein
MTWRCSSKCFRGFAIRKSRCKRSSFPFKIPGTRKPGIIRIYGPDRRLDQRPGLNPDTLPFGISGEVFTPIPLMSRTPVALDLRHASLQMGGPDSFGTPPPYHKTLSGDLGLIHRAHRGFAYRDFTTGEDEGSCPWVSRVPKHQNLFTLNHFGVSHIGFRDWRIQGNLPLGFPGAETPKHQNLFTLNHFGVSHIGIS